MNVVTALCDTPDLGPVHPALGVHVVFLSVSRKDEIYVRVVLECHEGVGVARAHGEPSGAADRTLLSLLVVPDFASAARAMLLDVARETDLVFLPCDPAWLEQVVRELE